MFPIYLELPPKKVIVGSAMTAIPFAIGGMIYEGHSTQKAISNCAIGTAVGVALSKAGHIGALAPIHAHLTAQQNRSVHHTETALRAYQDGVGTPPGASWNAHPDGDSLGEDMWWLGETVWDLVTSPFYHPGSSQGHRSNW